MIFAAAAVLINVIFPGLFFGQVKSSGLGLIGEIWNRPLWKQSLEFGHIGVGTATIGTIIGGVLATIRARWDFTAAKLLDMTAWVLLIAPSFMIAQGWVLFAGSDGLAHQWLGLTWVTSFIFQPAGLVFVMSLSKFPLAYLAITAKIGVEYKAVRLCDQAERREAIHRVENRRNAIGSAFLCGWLDPGVYGYYRRFRTARRLGDRI